MSDKLLLKKPKAPKEPLVINPDKLLLNGEEMCQVLGCSRPILRRWCREKRVIYFNWGRKYYFPVDANRMLFREMFAYKIK